MGSRLLGSVGAHGANIPSDVKAVQYLLSIRGAQPGAIDSRCGNKTIAAIERFQSVFMRDPDGLVERDGATWARLAGQSQPPAVARKPSAPATPIRPRTTTPARISLPRTVVVAPANLPTGASIAQLIPVPSKSTLNRGVSPVSNSYMFEKLGKPRPEGGYGKNDSAITNPKLLRAMTTQSVGPFRVTGLAPAVASLAAVFGDVRVAHPNVYGALISGGMKVCRYQRGSTSAISNHSWGTAIDLGLRGHGVDPRGDDKAYFGLALIAPIFNRHGWYWGAAFGKEDAMHFEAGRSLIDQWSRLVT